MGAREELAEVLKWRDVFLRRPGNLAEQLTAEFTAKVIEEARKAKPRKKIDTFSQAASVLGYECVDFMKVSYQQTQDEVVTQCRKALEALEPLIQDLADKAEIKHSLVPLCFLEVHESQYLSQGFGAKTYAEGHAKQAKMHVEFNGVQAEVVFEEGASRGGSSFKCMAYVESDVDIEILRIRKTLPLKDWMKACWKMGTNPRVYQPMLPVGLEEKMGIDYFGNDKC